MYPNRKISRANWHNYQNGCYFITICTKNKTHYFGNINNGTIHLSTLGKELEKIILETISIRENQFIEIPIYTIMPNHIHIIITLNTDIDFSQHYFQAQTQNISSIIRGIKCRLTSFALKNNIPFQWQSRYHDRIIRNQTEFDNIYQYIDNNVINWENDEFH